MSNPRFSLLGRYFVAAFAFSLIAVILAYQFRLPFSLNVGGPIDRPLLVWVHDPQLDKAAGIRYRWTTGGSEMYIRDWGAGNPVALRVRVTRYKPPDGIAALTLYINGLEFARPEASGQGWQEYTLQVTDPKFLASDDLRVKFVTDTFVPKDEMPDSKDPRRLGVQLDSISLSPLPDADGGLDVIKALHFSPAKFPPADLTLFFVGSVLALYLALACLRISSSLSLLGSAGLSVGAAVALVWVRPYVTLFAETFFLTMLAAAVLTMVARAVTPLFFEWGGVYASERDLTLLALMFGLAFLIKLDFLLYPQTISFDLLYHVHRLQGLLQGIVYWTHQSTRDILGGQQVPYQPSLYIFLTPLAALGQHSSDYLQLLIQLSGVLFESISVFIPYYWLKKFFGSDERVSRTPSEDKDIQWPERAGLLASWISLAVPLGSIVLSMGVYTDIYGQFMTLLLLVALLEGMDKLTTPRVAVLVMLVTALALLAHAAVLVSLVPLFGVWFLFVFGHPQERRIRSFFALVGSIAAASFIAFVLYYSDFATLLGQGTLKITPNEPIASVEREALSFWQLLQPARTEFIAVHEYVYFSALLGLGGLVLSVWKAPNPGRKLFVTMLVAWSAAFALLLTMRAALGFSPRYVSFAMPAIAICAGAAWAWLAARGLIGRLAVAGLLLLLTAQGAYHWYVLAMFKYH